MLELFSQLTPEEIIKFEKLINSPYFNSVEKVTKLFYYLKDLHPLISKDDLSREKISLKVFKNENLSQELLWKLKSDFTKVFEKFLVLEEIDNDSLNYDTTLIKALRKRGAKKELENNLNKIKKNRNKIYNKDDNFYLSKIYINEEEYYLKMPGILYEFPDCLQAKSDNLDYYFIFMKFHSFHEMFIHQYYNVKPLNFSKTLYKESTDFVKQNSGLISKDHPNIYVIYLVLLMFSNNVQEASSQKLIKYLKLNEKNFSHKQLSYYYRYIESFYYLKINEGQSNLNNDLYQLYKTMFEKDLFVLENIITDKEFNNVINISLPLGKHQWTNTFIEKYKDHLQPDLAIESYNLAKAKYYFYTKDYKKVFPHLHLIHYKDPHYYINSKVLLAKVLFETSSFDTLKSMLESLRKYISREKNLTEQMLSGIKNFIKFMTLLAKIKEENRKEEISVLKKLIANESKFISSKSWFIEMIEVYK